MSFHPLKAEPMVRSPYPTHPGFQSDLELLMCRPRGTGNGTGGLGHVGANQLWSCWDLQLRFGDIAPGEEVSCTGHVLVMDSNLDGFVGYDILAELGA